MEDLVVGEGIEEGGLAEAWVLVYTMRGMVEEERRVRS
jgi:hypothetical protein